MKAFVILLFISFLCIPNIFSQHTIKLRVPDLCVAATSDINHTELDSYITVNPNPSPGAFIIDLSNSNQKESISITIFNIQGKIIKFSKTIPYKENIIIDLGNYPDGLYFLQIRENTNSFYQKLILQR